jgi:hypothetical protein
MPDICPHPLQIPYSFRNLIVSTASFFSKKYIVTFVLDKISYKPIKNTLMSIRTLYQLSALLLFSIFFINCADEEPMNPVVENPDWKRLSNFANERRIQLNSFVVDDQLYTVGREYFTHLEATGDAEIPYVAQNNFLYFISYYSFQPPISAMFFPMLLDNFLSCSDSRSPTLSQANLNIDFLALDSLFRYFEIPSYKSTPGCGINDENQLLVAYKRRTAPNSQQVNTSFYLAKIELSSGAGPLDTVNQHFIHEDFGIQNITGITTVNSDFYVCGDDIAVRINSAGEIEKLDGPGLTKIYGFGEKLIGIGFKKAYASEDDGISWAEIASFDDSLFELKLHDLDGEIIATFEDKIYHFIDSEGNFLFQEIENEHLEDILITSLSKFDNQVFLTTLSGVFRKGIEDFWTYKE